MRFKTIRFRQRFVTVGGLANLIAATLKMHSQHFAKLRIIVGKQ